MTGTDLNEVFNFLLFGRRYVLINTWKISREIFLTPSLSIDFFDGTTLDFSFLNFKFYTYRDYINYD